MSRAESYSRYSDGHRCRWRRLLGYHMNGKGIQSTTPAVDLMIGNGVHKCLETILTAHARDRFTSSEAAELFEPILRDLRTNCDSNDVLAATHFENADQIVALTESLSHAWTRITYPWVQANYEVLMTERLLRRSIDGVDFYAKPDFVTRNKTSGVIEVHDFKTLSYWDDESKNQWDYSIQLYLTSHLVSLHLNEPVSGYYIHPLVKGNAKYPSPIVVPWVAPAVTPTGTPSFSLKWKKGFAREYAYLHKPVPEFIWDLPPGALTKHVPVAGPFTFNQEIALDFIDGAKTEHSWWLSNLKDLDWSNWADPSFQAEIVTRFPRSYNCWDFKRLCPFHTLCFRLEGWEDPYSHGYEPRSFK